MAEAKKNLKQKLQDIKSEVAIMQKNKEGHGYKYVDEESLLLVINDEMIKKELRLIPNIIPGTLKTDVINYQNSKGQPKTDVLVQADMEFIWDDISSGETEKVTWALVGQQADASQSLGSGLTYCNRYFLLKYFNVATTQDDPDKIRSEIAAEEERKKITPIQTNIKKALAILTQTLQTQDAIYKKLGTTKEQFTKDYNNSEQAEKLLEQMKLVINELKEKQNA